MRRCVCGNPLPRVSVAAIFAPLLGRPNRGVAQLVARLHGVQEVVGSNPATPTIKRKAHESGLFLCSYFTLVSRS